MMHSDIMRDVLEMPAVVTDNLSSNAEAYVKKATDEVRNEDSHGLEERYDGHIPVYIHDSPNPAGYTKFSPSGAEYVSISRHVPEKKIARVAKHEMRHVRAERLMKYADVDEKTARLIAESYAEYVGIKNAKSKDEAIDIIATTPYLGAVKFACAVEQHYKSAIDGKEGYRAFIRDIFKNKSMYKTIARLDKCLKAGYN
jgi:hypothetical protein